jgi:hypothetical protein
MIRDPAPGGRWHRRTVPFPEVALAGLSGSWWLRRLS